MLHREQSTLIVMVTNVLTHNMKSENQNAYIGLNDLVLLQLLPSKVPHGGSGEHTHCHLPS